MLHTIPEILGPTQTLLASVPAPLPPPPALQAWLFERPILSALVLAAFGLAALILLFRRGEQKRGLIVGGALIGGAVAIAALGILVETTHERLIRLSNDLVDAAAEGRVDDAEAMLSDDLVIAMGGTTLPLSGGTLARQALNGLRDEVRVNEHYVSEESATVVEGGDSGASQFLVRATSNAGPGTAWFRLNWRLDASGEWRIHLIEVLRVNGQNPEGAGMMGVLGR
jgi:hypothetical protein